MFSVKARGIYIQELSFTTFQLRFFDSNPVDCCFSPREMFEYAKWRILEQIRIKNTVYGDICWYEYL